MVLLRRIWNFLKSKKGGANPYGKGIVLSGPGIGIVNTTFDEYAFVAHHAEIMNSHIGKHSSVGRYDKIRDAEIGRYCCFSWDCTIGAPTHPYKTITNSAITYRKEYNVVDEDSNIEQKRTYIGNDVWIGCGVSIISGVRVGNGAILGAGAVVTNDVPMYEIWAGVPAKKIGQRFSDEIIMRVNNLKWWDWSTEEIKNCLDLFEKEMCLEVIEELEYRHQNFVNV